MELKESFEAEVLGVSDKNPVLVDFWAPWCGPCQVLGPVLEQVAAEMKDKLELVKVNVDEHQNLATEYGVRGIPQVTLFHKGQAIGSFTGALTKPQIMNWLEEHLPSKEKDEWNELEKKWSEVPDEKAIPALKKFTESYPEHEPSQVLLARHTAFFNPEEAAEFIQSIKMESEYYDIAEHIKFLSGIAGAAYLQTFRNEFLDNDLLHAFKQLNESVLNAALDEKEKLEKLGVALYSIANSKNPDHIKARKVFDMYTSG